MNIASNVTLVRVSMVWLLAVAMALVLVVSNIAPATAQSTATVMVSNLGEAPEVRQHSRIIVGMGQAYAHSFHTGSTAVTLEKVRLYLRGLGSAPAVTIRADNSGEPGRSLQALTNPTIDSLITTHEDLTTTGYVLAADTTYWLVLHRPWGSDNIRIDTSICDRLSTPEGVTTGEVGWSLGESLFFGLGSSWKVAPMGCRRMRMAVYASAQTTSQNQAANSPATGWPGITGTVRAGETLTATTDRIEDEDGLTDAVFAYRWVRQDPATRTDADIEVATSSTYTVTDADEGKAIKVRVTFDDDAGNAESLTSDARLSAPPLAIPEEETPLTAAIHDAPESHDGEKRFTFELRFSEDPKEDFSYKTLRDHAFTVTRGTVAGARRLDGDSDTRNIKWEISITPDSNADVTVELPATEDCDAQGAICAVQPAEIHRRGASADGKRSHNGNEFDQDRLQRGAENGLQRCPCVHGDGRQGNRRAPPGQQQHRLGGRRRTGLQRRRDHRAARNHGLQRAGRDLHRGRQAAVQPAGDNRQRAGRIGRGRKSGRAAGMAGQGRPSRQSAPEQAERE